VEGIRLIAAGPPVDGAGLRFSSVTAAELPRRVRRKVQTPSTRIIAAPSGEGWRLVPNSTCKRVAAPPKLSFVAATLGQAANGGESPGSIWVHALVDAARAGADGAPSFRRTVWQWLEEAGRGPITLQQARGAL
jgi:hypothetical protein